MNKTILIVDDCSTTRLVLNDILGSAGHRVLEAADGLRALHCLDGRVIDLVVCDLNMPVVDGLTFLDRAHRLPAYAKLPVIVLTSDDDAQVKEQCRSAGASAWMVKPPSPRRLLDTVKRLLQP